MMWMLRFFVYFNEDESKVVAISDVTTSIPIEGTQIICIALSGNITWMKDGRVLFHSSELQIIHESFYYGGRLYQLSLLKFCSPLTEFYEGSYRCLIHMENTTIEEDTRLQIKSEKKFRIIDLNRTLSVS